MASRIKMGSIWPSVWQLRTQQPMKTTRRFTHWVMTVLVMLTLVGCSDGARYKLTIYGTDGKEISELTRYGSSFRHITEAGPMLIDVKTGEHVYLPYVPKGARVEVMDLKTKKVVHSY